MKITSDPTKQIMLWIHYDTMKHILAHPDHFHMSTTGFDLVDWDAVEMVMAGFPEMFWLWAAKHMSHFCSIGWMQLICGF
jgi:hypothetical protein